MNENKLLKLEKGLISIGDKICEWRNDYDARKLTDISAFKTNADYRAHLLLSALILEYFPNAIILSEEDENLNCNRPECYWLLDPIDGTASWHDGFDGFVTQIAYIENSIPIYGAVYAPVLNKLWTGMKNKGARLNGTLLPKLTNGDRLNLIDNYPEPRYISKKISDHVQVSKYIECGSLGLKSCMVADGTADLFVKDVVIRDWDVAPASVIISEVGGVMTDLDGCKIQYWGAFEKENGLIVARDSHLLQLAMTISAAQ